MNGSIRILLTWWLLLSEQSLAAPECTLSLEPLGVKETVKAEGGDKAALKEALIRDCAASVGKTAQTKGELRHALLRARCARLVAKAVCKK